MTVDNLPAVPVNTLVERQEYAKALSVSDLLPREYRGKPGNVLYAVEFGRSIGVDPIVAINEVHIIEGKPSSSAGLVTALVRQAGHKMRVWIERNDQGEPKAIATIHRKDDPDFEFRSEWTLERARTAGLLGKQVWKNYPEAMLKARAETEVARDACKEALCGLGYTPEELGAETDADGRVVSAPTQTRASAPGQTVRHATAATPAPEPPPVPDGMAEQMITDAQQKKIGALMREAGITGRDAALAFVADVIGRQIGSRKELTRVEAGKVIDALETENTAPAVRPQEPVDADQEEPVDGDIVDDTPDGAEG